MELQYFGILDVGTPGLILILLIALLLFGGKKLPELSRSIATSLREIRKGMGEGNEKNETETQEKAKRESNS